MDYHDQPLNFINKNIFQIKDTRSPSAGPASNRYLFIKATIELILILPIILIITTNTLCCAVENRYIPFNVLIEVFTVTDEKTKKLYVFSNLLALFLTNLAVSIILFLLHYCSFRGLYHYAHEIYSDDDPKDVIMVHNIFIAFFIYLAILVTMTIRHFIYTWCNTDQMCTTKVSKIFFVIIIVSIKFNMIYILSYFMPYMIMAFIYYTLETTITYLILTVFVVGVYLVCWGIIRSITLCCLQCKCCSEDGNNTTSKSGSKNGNSRWYTIYLFAKRCLHISSYAMFPCAMVIVLVLFVNILTLGGFNDFEAAHNLVIVPALVALIGIFITKPFYVLIEKTYLANRDERNKPPMHMVTTI